MLIHPPLVGVGAVLTDDGRAFHDRQQSALNTAVDLARGSLESSARAHSVPAPTEAAVRAAVRNAVGAYLETMREGDDAAFLESRLHHHGSAAAPAENGGAWHFFEVPNYGRPTFREDDPDVGPVRAVTLDGDDFAALGQPKTIRATLEATS